MTKTKILIADDHAIVREGLSALLQSDPEFQVVATAENGRDAIAAAATTHPEIILMDLAMPIMNGLTATRLILKNSKRVKILALSSYNDQRAIDEIVEAGASGYILKATASSDLLGALRRIRDGRTAFSPAIENQRRHREYRQHFDGPKGCTLTTRESQVLQLIAEGFTNKTIADELQISVKTVEKHRQQAMNKLNIHEIAGLTRYAVENSLVVAPPFNAHESPLAR